MKKIFIAILICVLVVFSFLFYINMQPLVPENANESFNTYAKYLKRSFNNDYELKVYFSKVEGENYNYYVSVYNDSDYFYCGDIYVLDESGETICEISCINVQPDELRHYGINEEKEPVDYKVKNERIYAFNYEKPIESYTLSLDLDTDSSYPWRNVILKQEDLTVEKCLELGKYFYILDILSGSESMDTYCYLEGDVQYYDTDGEKYPLRSSAIYGIVLNQQEKSVKIVDLIANLEILEEFFMN